MTAQVRAGSSRVGALLAVALLGAAAWCGWSALKASRPPARAELPAGPPPADKPSPFDRFAPSPTTSGPPEAVAVLADPGSQAEITAVAISPDGEWVAAGAGDAVVVWRAGQEAPAARLGPLPGPVRALAFRADGKALLLGGRSHPPELGPSGWAQLWLIKDGSFEAGPSLSETIGVRAVAFLPGGDQAVLGGTPVELLSPSAEAKKRLERVQFVRLGPSRIEPVAEPLDGTNPVTALAVSPDGRTLAVLSEKRTLQALHLGANSAPVWPRWALASLLVPGACIAWCWPRLAVSLSKERAWELAALLIVGGAVICAAVWLSPHLSSRPYLLDMRSAATGHAVAFSPDGGTLVLAEPKGTGLYERDRDELRQLSWKGDLPGKVVALAVAPGGPWLTTVEASGRLRVTSLATQATLRTVEGVPTGHLAVTPDGRHAVVGGRGGALVVLRLWGLDGAEKDLEEAAAALARDPADPFALEQRARVLLRRGRLRDAVSDLTRALAGKPSKEAYLLRAMAHARLEDRLAAVRDLEGAVGVGPTDALAHYHLGLLRLQQKDYRNARKSLDEAFRLDPGLAREAGVADKETAP